MNIKKEEKLALLLLDQLMLKDPNNSAPIVFAALIEKNIGHIDRSNELLKKIPSTKYFNSYITNIEKAIYRKVESTEDYVQAVELAAKLPIPKYSKILDMFEKNSPHKLVKQLTADALNSNNIVMNTEWVPMEYSIGKKLNDKYALGENLMNTRDLINHKFLFYPELVKKSSEEFGKSCDLTTFDSYLVFIKNRKY